MNTMFSLHVRASRIHSIDQFLEVACPSVDLSLLSFLSPETMILPPPQLLQLVRAFLSCLESYTYWPALPKVRSARHHWNGKIKLCSGNTVTLLAGCRPQAHVPHQQDSPYNLCTQEISSLKPGIPRPAPPIIQTPAHPSTGSFLVPTPSPPILNTHFWVPLSLSSAHLGLS